jgi:hypothetical protein
MRPSLLLVMFGTALLSIPTPQKAAAAPVTTTVPHLAPDVAGNSIDKIYYYRGRYYPYYYRGGYYPYRYGGRYYHHRYYRYGHWHYY